MLCKALLRFQVSVLLDGQKFIFRLELVVGEAVGERIKAMEGLSREKPQIWLAWLLKTK